MDGADEAGHLLLRLGGAHEQPAVGHEAGAASEGLAALLPLVRLDSDDQLMEGGVIHLYFVPRQERHWEIRMMKKGRVRI